MPSTGHFRIDGTGHSAIGIEAEQRQGTVSSHVITLGPPEADALHGQPSPCMAQGLENSLDLESSRFSG